ncbi:MAG: putative transcriptional regulator, TetR family [Microbacteriaceae bacterium]|jgi:AcrR family transcriptional regulator|nr:putative transcriptional regulator, TetR family [Microbacteriaceae bacterium]
MKESLDARVRILDAAEQLFARHGFDATATSAIAILAAVPKGLLFYYFPRKPDLLRALVAERHGLGPIDTTTLIEPGNPVRSLLNLTRKIHEIQRTSEVIRVIIWRERHTHPEVESDLTHHRSQVQEVIERVLQGSLHNPISAARLRTAAQAWLAILALRPLADGTESDDSVSGLQEFATLICDGLTTRVGRGLPDPV